VSCAATFLVSRIRADRKGGLGYATASAVGGIYVLLACTGNAPLCLWLALGNACCRMIQILKSPNVIHEHHQVRQGVIDEPPAQFAMKERPPDMHSHSKPLLRFPQTFATLGDELSLFTPPLWLYRLGWGLNRSNSGQALPLARLSALCCNCLAWPFSAKPMSKHAQWGATALLLFLAPRAPFMPLDAMTEHAANQLFAQQPDITVAVLQGGGLLLACALVSTACVWAVLFHVLDDSRFKHARG
jgi:hypothetical protein